MLQAHCQKYFDREKYDVRVILPKYASMKGEWKDKLQYRTHFEMHSWHGEICTWEYWRRRLMEFRSILLTMNIISVVAGHMKTFGGILKNLHFSLRAVLSALPSIDFRPDIIHCHDWQAALVPAVYLNDAFSPTHFIRISRLS